MHRARSRSARFAFCLHVMTQMSENLTVYLREGSYADVITPAPPAAAMQTCT